MRRRFMTTLVGLVAVVVLLYAVPRAVWVVQQERVTQVAQVDRVATLVTEVLATREEAGPAVTAEDLGALVGADEWATWTRPDGTQVRTRDDAAPAPRDVVATHEVEGHTLVLVRSGDVVDRESRDDLRAIVLIGVVLIALAFAVANALARWLARPFQNLADAAVRLGEGDFDVDLPRSGLPEADAVGDALRQSADGLRRLLEREREFTVHASHELRTPLTAMQLELEDLAYQTQDHPAGEQVVQVLAGLERLQGAVDAVLERGRERGPSDAAEIDLAARLTDVVQAWNGSGTACTVVLGDVPPVTLRASRTTLDRTLELLLRHVCAPGCGPVSVGAHDLGDAVRITVADASRSQGTEVFTRSLDRTDAGGDGENGATAQDVVAAREAAERMGGRLTLGPGPATTFMLTIPRG